VGIQMAEFKTPMVVIVISALVYLFLLILTPALLWKSANRLMDIRVLKAQIQKRGNAAPISGRKT
jgi:hypothetical protein